MTYQDLRKHGSFFIMANGVLSGYYNPVKSDLEKCKSKAHLIELAAFYSNRLKINIEFVEAKASNSTGFNPTDTNNSNSNQEEEIPF